MNIYSILSSKPHNTHHLNRYINFIESCKQQTLQEGTYVEKHHICPKAKDMFPDYLNFKEHPWNKVLLTGRQHFIAHMILWKVYPKINSQKTALHRMYYSKQNSGKITAKQYESLKIDFIKIKIEQTGISSRDRVKKGTHNFCGLNNSVHKKVKDGTHHFLGKNNPVHKKVKDGTHHFLGSSCNDKRVKNGTHPFLNKQLARERALKRILNGTNNFKNKISVINRGGECIYIEKSVYYSQAQENKEYVAVGSKEGYLRRGKIIKTGYKHSEETREKMRLSKLNVKKIICQYCLKLSDPGNHKKHHGIKCKNNV